ncbi:MAG: glycosyltransferase [Gemmatimonadetes bacterium]|nr:glycosyltransferase [Gemmatimonadota bacterium]
MSRRLRVLALAHAFPREAGDPVGLFVAQLAIALRDRGIDTTVLAPSGPGLASCDSFEGIDVRRYRYARRDHETLAYTGTMGDQVRTGWGARLAFAGLIGNGIRHALRISDEIGADLVHAHWWVPGGVIGAAVNAIARVPLITTMHGTDVRMLDSAIGHRLYPLVAARSHSLTAVSTWLAERATIAGDRLVTVAPMPVRTEDFPEGPALREPRLLFVGKLTEQKGLHFLLEAMARCRTRPSLEVVGAGRVEDRELRERAVSLGVADRITWTPILPQGELAKRYRDARALVIPAIEEGLGLTAVEAALSGTPVIAFASGGVVDAVRHGQTGILVPARDVVRLADAIDHIVDEPAAAARMGGAGRRFALGHFSAAAVAATYADLYRRASES